MRHKLRDQARLACCRRAGEQHAPTYLCDALSASTTVEVEQQLSKGVHLAKALLALARGDGKGHALLAHVEPLARESVDDRGMCRAQRALILSSHRVVVVCGELAQPMIPRVERHLCTRVVVEPDEAMGATTVGALDARVAPSTSIDCGRQQRARCKRADSRHAGRTPRGHALAVDIVAPEGVEDRTNPCRFLQSTLHSLIAATLVASSFGDYCFERRCRRCHRAARGITCQRCSKRRGAQRGRGCFGINRHRRAERRHIHPCAPRVLKHHRPLRTHHSAHAPWQHDLTVNTIRLALMLKTPAACRDEVQAHIAFTAVDQAARHHDGLASHPWQASGWGERTRVRHANGFRYVAQKRRGELAYGVPREPLVPARELRIA